MTDPQVQVSMPVAVADHLEGLAGCRLATLRHMAESDPVLRANLAPSIAQYEALAEALAQTKKQRVKEAGRG